MDQGRLLGMRNAYLASQPLESIGSSKVDPAAPRRFDGMNSDVRVQATGGFD
jgi:hypothetical protein